MLKASYFEPSYKVCIFDPEPVPATEHIEPEDYNVGQPDCSDAGADHNLTVTRLRDDYIDPEIKLGEGLWCITGDLSLTSDDKLYGDHVTIYMVDGWFKSVAQAEIILSAPAKSPDPYPAIPGLLIYLPVSNGKVVWT